MDLNYKIHKVDGLHLEIQNKAHIVDGLMLD